MKSEALSQNSLSWSETLAIMEELMEHYDGPMASDEVANLIACESMCAKIEQKTKDQIMKASKIKSQILSCIGKEELACNNEKDDLNRHKRVLRDIEEKIKSLKEQTKKSIEEKKKTNDEIIYYRLEASKEIEKINEVEARRLKEVPRLKRNISLYANITGIRWKYENEKLRSGEIAISPKGEVHRFSIDPLQYSDFEISNAIWDLMDGKKSNVSSVSSMNSNLLN